ncbi:MAG TPA: 4-alpha-glucanotransferase [Thermomicrobiales bacterium]|nr:4-alpha-glucanotransferase [Thermomicrobiales bacterium]
MTLDRASGVLAHPTSFPGPHGIGDLGPGAFRFVDWLALGAQRLWQLMPLGPTGYGDSPYASPSAFAGNPLLISLSWLAGEGLLDDGDLAGPPDLPDYEVDFQRVQAYKFPLLRRAFDRFRTGAAAEQRPEFDAFRQAESSWLDDYALFVSLKNAHEEAGWNAWPEPIRLREPAALAEWRDRLATEIRFHQFVQFQFRRQWSELKRYANERDIQIIGDIPIFVAHDSADVWAHRDIFQLDRDGRPTVVAGVPPDPFSETGQLWGNPVYDWPANAASDYAWWIARIRATLQTVDIIRMDHFRGFAAAWLTPSGHETAAGGHWERGPGARVFEAIQAELGEIPMIVEDLGVITPDVIALREQLGFPGMKVLQFAFEDDPANPYLPHNYHHNDVVYTATHDNQTTVGWFQSRSEAERRAVQRYIGKDGSDIAWDLIRLALSSVADTAIQALQDVMRLGDEARMNVPGRPTGNWGWRFLPHQLHNGLAEGLGELTVTYGRGRPSDTPRGHNPYDYMVKGSAYSLS